MRGVGRGEQVARAATALLRPAVVNVGGRQLKGYKVVTGWSREELIGHHAICSAE
jgi:hypothetical protein